MLKTLPIIPSRTSQIFYLLFLFYSQVPPIIPFLFYCVNDIITMQDWLYIIYIVTDCFNTIFDCTIRVCRSVQTSWQGTASIWVGLGPARHAILLCHCLKLIYLVFHMFQLPIILILCLCTAYKFWNYSRQNCDLLFLKLCWHIRLKPTYITLKVTKFLEHFSRS